MYWKHLGTSRGRFDAYRGHLRARELGAHAGREPRIKSLTNHLSCQNTLSNHLRAQDPPGMSNRCPRDQTPKIPQEHPQSAEEVPKRHPKTFRNAQESSESAQDASKSRPRDGSLLPTGVVLGHLVATRSVLARLGAFCGIFTVQNLFWNEHIDF